MSTWRESAACRDHPHPEWWVGDKDGNHRGKQVCASCPVQAACLLDALAIEDQQGVTLWGVYGGLSYDDRRKLAIRRGVPGVGPRAVTLPVTTGARPRHGTWHAYARHRCRCQLCVEAARAARLNNYGDGRSRAS